MKKSLLAKAEAYTPKVDLKKVEEVAEAYRDLVKKKEELEELAADLGKEVEKMAMVTLPDLLDTAGIDHIGVPAKGNQAAFDVVLRPYFKATIAASWDDARKEKAFQALSKHSAGDLIRRVVTISIPHTHPQAADLERRMVAMADKVGLPVEVTKTVPWTSLTSWVKERVTKSKSLPPLDTIGATVGRKATIKDRKS